MRKEKEDRKLSKNEYVKSILLFFLHLVVLVAIVAVLLFGDKLGTIGVTLKNNAANYLYMLFCLILLTGILYVYFLFENPSILTSGKTITL